MAELPTGTVTFLLTDVEGSTRLWERHPAAMRAATARHDVLVEEIVGGNGGVVVRPRGEGDSRFAVFARASDAATAVVVLQRAFAVEAWPTPTPIRVRMALHTGEADLRDGDYYGAAVNRCARLRAVAHGGQVLVSRVTADLVRGALPLEIGFADLGEHRLRDLAAAERVFQLTAPGLPHAFPPLRSLDLLPNNLPRQLTGFVGRERELAEVKRLLASSPLVTLTGTGGCGKTRLALQVGADLLDGYPDGVWLVELAPLTDPALVPQAVASALGVRELPDRPLLATLVDHLRGRELLLVLDNCEHLLDAGARLADTLLRGCPNVRILATSREGLGIAGEVSWRVPSLTVPLGEGAIPLDELNRNECARLFAERTRAVLPAFTLTHQNAPAVAQICRRLDGIPLALELAAARLKGLAAEQLAARLDQRFRLLTGGSRVALPRQQTLAAMVGWSYDLLNEPERALFHRLAVFVGGFTLEAAEDVCPDTGDGGQPSPIQRDDVLDLLLRLVDKSLVVAEPSDEGESRYRLLETLRQYALEKLAATGETERVRARHAAHYLAFAEQAGAQYYGSRFPFWYARMRLELNNFRTALRWAIDAGEVEEALLICGPLGNILYHIGEPSESRRWLGELLASPAAVLPTIRRGRALVAAAYLAGWAELDFDQADILIDHALVIIRERADQKYLVEALAGKAGFATLRGNYSTGRKLSEEAVALARASEDLNAMASSLLQLGQACYYLGDYPIAQATFEERRAVCTRRGDTYHAPSLDWLGHISTARGEYATAGAHLRESMRQRLTIDRTIGVAYTLNGFAGLAAAQGDHPRAVRLSGAAARLCELSGMPANRAEEGSMRDRLPAIQAALGDAAYDAAWAEGRALTQEQAVAYALEEGGS
jgi:predicted ATPase/class 3 adenylate cyclase